MKLGIRQRILIAAILPLLLVAVLIPAMLLHETIERSHIDQHRRLAAIAAQIAQVAEYDIFIGDREALDKLVKSTLGDPDIIGAAIFDHRGSMLASSVAAESLPHIDAATLGFANPVGAELVEHWHHQPILVTPDYGNDLFEESRPSGKLVGHLLFKISNRNLHEELRTQALHSAGLSLLILLFAMAFAWLLSRRVIETLDEIRDVVAQVGRGYREQRVRAVSDDELGQLGHGINDMAESVEQTQDHLAARIAAATAELRAERDAAELASRSRSRFFAAASHDLRQPVQALGLFTTRLEQEIKHGPRAQDIHQVAESVRRLQALLNSLLEYSRLDGQVVDIRSQSLQAMPFLRSVAEDFTATAAQKQLSLRVCGRDSWLMTDPALLRRILINLIGNAVRYTRSGGVLVCCRPAGSEIRIEVWDTGPGIPPEQQGAIFEELIQLENPERDSEKGLGLGLAIVRRCAALLGHPLALCSRIGHGSRFSLRIPLAAPPDNLPEQIETAAALIIGSSAGEPLSELMAKWSLAVDEVEDVLAAKRWVKLNGAPAIALFETASGISGIRQAEAALAELETTAGQALPALFIGDGPVPGWSADPATPAPRQFLARPFLPARLRALVMHLLPH